MRQLVALSISAPRRTLAFVLTFVALVSTGTWFLRFDFSPEQVYGGQYEVIEFSEEHKRLFRFEDSITFVLLESTEDRTVLRPDTLQWMKQLGESAAEIPGVLDVTSLVTLDTPRLNLRQQSIQWTKLIPERRFEDSKWLDRRLEKIPLLNDLLISRDRQLALVLISLDPADRNIDTLRERVKAIRDLLERLDTPGGTRVALSGVPAIRVDVIDSLVDDQFTMTPLSAALFIVIAMFMYRSWQVTAVSLLSVLAAVGMTMGIMGWCGMTFSILSNIVPTLVLIIGAANCVHVIGRLQILLRQDDGDPEDTIRRVMKEMSRTCFLTLATTAIGFGSLLVARSDLLQLLALQAAMGMACNYLCLMLILPSGLMLTVHHLRRPGTGVAQMPTFASSAAESAGWNRLAAFVCRHAPAIVTVHLLIAAAAVAGALNTEVNSYMFETYDTDHPMVQVSRTLDDKMSGLISLEVQLQTDARDRFFDADMIDACQRIRAELSQDPRITFTRDYVELLSAFDDRILDSDSRKSEAAIRRVQRILPRIDRRRMTSAFLADELPRTRIMLRVRDIGSSRLTRLIADVEDVLARELPDDVRYQLTGDAYLHTVCMDQFVRDLFYSLLAASGIIFVLIGLLFRSFRTGLVSALPNLFPLTMTLGYMYLRGYELTAGNVIVFAISLGIAVDDTIHFLARYREEEKHGTDPDAAISAALRSSGRAIVLTSLLVVSGLSVLIFSDFMPTRRFSELTAITMLAALPGDVVLLPAMLSLLRRRQAT